MLLSVSAVAQIARYDSPGVTTTANIGGVPGILKVVPNANVRICTAASLNPGIPCTPLATTFTDSTGTVACPITSQVVLAGTNTCTSTADAFGNFGFWGGAGLLICQISGGGVATTNVPCGGQSGGSFNVPVETFGAVGDWNGTTGTDNTVPIQNCLNSLTAGQNCQLLAKAYKVSGTLTINKSLTGLVGTNTVLTNPAAYVTAQQSTIISTSASADIIDVVGTSVSNTISNTRLSYFTVARSVIPSGSAKGISIVFSYGAQVQSVGSADSIYDFYFKGVGCGGIGYIENSEAFWGFNGFTETSGNLYGFYVDSAGGVPSQSLRIRNSTAAQNTSAGAITYGLAAVGILVSDLHVIHFETGQNINYGEYVNELTSGFTNGSDLHFVDMINDNCLTFCMQINGLTGSLNITGGWSACLVGCSATLDFESSANITLVNHTSTTNASSPAILAHNSTGISIVDTGIYGSSTTPIVFNGTAGGKVSGASITGSGATGITMTGSTNVLVGNNVFGSGVNTGISIDAASHGIVGLETNTCIPAVGVCISDAGGNYIFRTGAGPPGGNCGVGSIYTNTSAASASTVLYVCQPANTWTAITVP